MTGEVIKSFLVGLGFGVDDASLSKFNKSIAGAALKVTALYATIKASAAGIFYSITKISEGFEEMGYNLRLVAPAVNKMLLLRQAMLDAYRKAGVDLTKVVKQSILFNFSLAKTKFALEAVYKSVGARFLPMLTKQMDLFRLKIFANMPKIQATLEKFVAFIFKAFEATTILGARIWSILGRVYDFLVKLDTATGGWSTKILGFIAVWKLLNLSFLATPLGMVLTGLLAIVALYDDFKVWEEGGQAFFNWGKALPVLDAIKQTISGLIGIWQGFVDVVLDLVLAFQQLQFKSFTEDFSNFFDALGFMGKDVIALFTHVYELIQGIGNFANSAGNLISGLFGHAQPSINGVMQPQPLLPQNASTNQKVNQETNILVQGSADALATGRAVAGEQGKVNFDLTRNLRGATR